MQSTGVAAVTAFTAHREWASRPPDERYASVSSLYEAARARRERTEERIVETNRIRTEASRGHDATRSVAQAGRRGVRAGGSARGESAIHLGVRAGADETQSTHALAGRSIQPRSGRQPSHRHGPLTLAVGRVGSAHTAVFTSHGAVSDRPVSPHATVVAIAAASALRAQALNGGVCDARRHLSSAAFGRR